MILQYIIFNIIFLLISNLKTKITSNCSKPRAPEDELLMNYERQQLTYS